MIRPMLLVLLLTLSACSALGQAQDRRVDPGAAYRPIPDPPPSR